MKQALIIHGWGGSPEGNWFPWLKAELETRGYQVMVPAMPDPDMPNRQAWLSTVQSVLREPGPETLIVGHSLGCMMALQYLQSLDDTHKVAKLILVSGFIRSLGNPATDGFFTEPLAVTAGNWPVREIIAISSDNDPYVPFSEAEYMAQRLGVALNVMPGAGHINAESGYVTLPEIMTYLG